jgi:putative chitinase
MHIIDVVNKFCPNAKPAYIQAFKENDSNFVKYGVNSTKRVSQFLAQTIHETGQFTIFVENGNYNPERIPEVWPTRFKTVAAASPYAHNPQKLFNNVYANRMGNGPESSGDGYKYRGRGTLQTTGKESYDEYGKELGIDLVTNPDLLLDPKYILLPALLEWHNKGCNEFADKGDINSITLKINGGYTGLTERKQWLSKIQAFIGSSNIEFASA